MNELNALTEGVETKKKQPSVMQIVRKILTEEAPLAQVGPYIYKRTQAENGWVDYSNDIFRKAAIYSDRDPKRAGILSALSGWIEVPQATCYCSTPYFLWKAPLEQDFEDNAKAVNTRWVPYHLEPSCIALCDGTYNVVDSKFTPVHEIGELYGPMIMVPYSALKTPATAQYNEFLRTLEQVMPDPAVRNHFQKIAGTILQPHVPQKFGIFLVGESGCRKSTVATTLACAPAGVGGFSIEALDTLADKDFAQCALLGKFINFSDDPTGKSEKWVNWFKRYTGSSIMRAEFKFVNARNYPATAKLVTCCNNIPRMADNSDAVLARLQVFQFKTVEAFTANQDNRKLSVEYWSDTDTRACIVAWLIEGLRKAKTEGLATPPEVKRWNSEAAVDADPIRFALLDHYRMTNDGEEFIPTQEVIETLRADGYAVATTTLNKYMQAIFRSTSERQDIKDERAPGGKRRVRGYRGVSRK